MLGFRRGYLCLLLQKGTLLKDWKFQIENGMQQCQIRLSYVTCALILRGQLVLNELSVEPVALHQVVMSTCFYNFASVEHGYLVRGTNGR